MNWLTEYVRPKIQGLLKTDIPDNLWTNCPSCNQMLLFKDLEKNMNICPHCNHHMRASVKQRLDWTFDPDSYSCIDLPKMPVDPLNFKDKKRYTDRLKESRTKSKLEESIAIAHGTIESQKAVVAIMAFEFMAGTMGAAFGEGFLAAARLALAQKSPLIIFTASGGARMQEGMVSLMQMPRTVIAVELLKEAKIPYIVVFTNPTTGGVTASFAMLGDIHIAEPDALIGFAGPRVIENTVHEKLPEGFQRSEYLLEHGMIDMVVKRTEMRSTLANLIKLLCHPKEKAA